MDKKSELLQFARFMCFVVAGLVAAVIVTPFVMKAMRLCDAYTSWMSEILGN